MSADLNERIEFLERSRRCWRLLAVAGWGLLGLLVAFVGVYGVSLNLAAREAAEREQVARHLAEETRRQAEMERVRAEQAMQEAIRQRDQAEAGRREAEKAK
jgi:flagellar biosynthesis/type III secretory pathway M-ring protein FliF/YscJ